MPERCAKMSPYKLRDLVYALFKHARTSQQIGELLGFTEGPVAQWLTLLWRPNEDGQRLCYISSWAQAGDGGWTVPRYQWGNRPDVCRQPRMTRAEVMRRYWQAKRGDPVPPVPCVPQGTEPTGVSPWGPKRRKIMGQPRALKNMLHLLLEGATQEELIEGTGLTRRCLQNYLTALHAPADGLRRVVYVCEWLPDARGAHLIKRYKIGLERKDAPKPECLSAAEKWQRWHRKGVQRVFQRLPCIDAQEEAA